MWPHSSSYNDPYSSHVALLILSPCPDQLDPSTSEPIPTGFCDTADSWVQGQGGGVPYAGHIINRYGDTHHRTQQAGGSFKWAPSAIYFDGYGGAPGGSQAGDGDYLEAYMSHNITSGWYKDPFTIETWIMIEHYPEDYHWSIIGKGDAGPSGGAWIPASGVGERDFEIFVTGPHAHGGGNVNSIPADYTEVGSGKLAIFGLGAADPASRSYPVYSTGQLSLNDWHHIAVVREGDGIDQMKLFIDGCLDRSWTFTNDVFCSPANLLIGAQGWTHSDGVRRIGTHDEDPYFIHYSWFQGYLEDIRITRDIARYTCPDSSNCDFPNAIFTNLRIINENTTDCFFKPILKADAVTHSLGSDDDVTFHVNCCMTLPGGGSLPMGGYSCDGGGNFSNDSLQYGMNFTLAQLLKGIDLNSYDNVNAAEVEQTSGTIAAWLVRVIVFNSYCCDIFPSWCDQGPCYDSEQNNSRPISHLGGYILANEAGTNLYTNGTGTFPQFTTFNSVATLTYLPTGDKVIQLKANVLYYLNSLSSGNDPFDDGKFKIEIQYDTSCNTTGGCGYIGNYAWQDGIDNDTSLYAGIGGAGNEQTFDVVAADCWNEDYIFVRYRIVSRGCVDGTPTVINGPWTDAFLGEIDVLAATVQCASSSSASSTSSASDDSSGSASSSSSSS